MDSGPGWFPDPEDEEQERYWSGSTWTGRVRPVGTGRSTHLPEHVPELQRALAAATADIEAVEDRLSNLFDRTEGRVAQPAKPAPKHDPDSRSEDPGRVTTADPDVDQPIEFDEEPIDFEYEPTHPKSEGPSDPDEDGDVAAFAELDAALAAEEPEDAEPDVAEEPEAVTPRRGIFHRRS